MNKFKKYVLMLTYLLIFTTLSSCSTRTIEVDLNYLINTVNEHGYDLENALMEHKEINFDEIFGTHVLNYYLLNSENISIGIIESNNSDIIYDDLVINYKENFEPKESKGYKNIELSNDLSSKYVLDSKEYYVYVLKTKNIVFFLLSMSTEELNAKTMTNLIDLNINFNK